MQVLSSVSQFLSGCGEFIMWLLSLGQHMLIFALLLLAVMIAFALLGLLSRKNAQARGNKQAAAHNLTKVHPDLVYNLRAALANQPARNKLSRARPASGKVTAVLRFEGDTMATGRQDFARMVDEVLHNKERIQRVIVVVNSPGGGVSVYGQMFAGMERMRNAGVDVTACVDTYAASGGYLMSVPAQRIIAAPFAMVGSIGVVSEFMNFNKLLRRLGVEPMTITAGELKRTVTPLSEVTEENKAAYKAQLEAIHRQFIAVVKKYREVDADRVCTGNHWTAAESVELKLNLVDGLATSQEYLFEANQTEDLVTISKLQNPYEKSVLGLARRFIHLVADEVSERFSGRL